MYQSIQANTEEKEMREERLALVAVVKESIGEVEDGGFLRGHLQYHRLVHRENVVFHAQIQDEMFQIGRSDAYGHVSGEISGMLLADGSYDLMVDGVEPQAIIRVSYSSHYELPGSEPCDNFGCGGPCGQQVCPECRDEHFILLRQERDDLREQVEKLEQEIVILKEERDYWETKYRTN